MNPYYTIHDHVTWSISMIDTGAVYVRIGFYFHSVIVDTGIPAGIYCIFLVRCTLL